MKIRQIEVFLAVAETGGVRRAANRLCITQSAVAKAIGQLEAELGCPLFDRSALGLRLNEAGQSLLPYAESIASNATRAAAAVAACATGRVNSLRLAITPTLPEEVLSAAVQRFRLRFPAVKLIFSSGFFSDCLPKILTDRLDLALVMAGRHQHEELTSLVEEPLCTLTQGVVAGKGHPVLAPDSDLKTLLSKAEWLTTVQDEVFLIRRLHDFGVTAPRCLTLCDYYTVDALNGTSGALSLSPLCVVDDPRYANRHLEALDPRRFPLPPLTVSFFRQKGVELSPTADYMRFSICEAFKGWCEKGHRRFVQPF
jgi:LysR family transcriptional regulator of abg operon